MRRPVSFGLIFAFSTATLLGQKSEAEQRADIAFAKGLGELGFVELSEKVLRNVESGGLSSKLTEEVALLRCDALYDAAKADASRREELLKKAVEAYQAFLDKYKAFGDADIVARAQARTVEVGGAYARVLASSMADLVGEELDAKRGAMRSFLEAAVGRVNDLIREQEELLKEGSGAEGVQRRLFELLLNGADLNLQLARVQEVPTTFSVAEKMYVKLSDTAGEGTPWSLRAYIGIGDVYAAQGAQEDDFKSAAKLYQEAASYYEFAVNFSIPRDLAAWREASAQMLQPEKQSRFLFLQLGTPGLVKANIAAGDTTAALTWALHYVNTWKREGLELTPPQGYMALLDVTQALVSAGGFLGGNPAVGDLRWFESQEALSAASLPKKNQRSSLDFALSLAQEVAAENKGNNLQVRAQRVIGEIIARPGVRVDPSVLMDAAKGEFNAQDWATSVEAFKRVVRSLDGSDIAARQERMPEALWHIARSYQRMDRVLEAAAVYEHALESWSGDPKFDGESAKGFYDCAQLLKRTIKGDSAIDALAGRADEVLKRAASGTGKGEDIKYRDAEKLYADNKFDEARAAYASVGAGAESYEKAKVNVGVCEFKLKRYEAAIRTLESYLNTYLRSTDAATTDARRLARRKEATANARFYWGLAEFEVASGGANSWQKVVDVLGTFQTEFPEQNQLAPAAMYRVLISYGKLDQQDKVKSLLGLMLSSFPDNRWTGSAATESYKMLKTAFEAEKDAAKKAGIEREMAENLQVLNRTSPRPSFDNMRAESRHWMNLSAWATAEELLERIQSQFGAEAEYAENMQIRVLPDLGEAQLRQKKVADAFATLKPLLMDEKVRAAKSTAYDFAQAAAGWLEVQGTKVIENAGAATSVADFELATKAINQLTDTSEKWAQEWYGLKAQQIYSYLRFAAIDGQRMDTARSLLGPMNTQLGGGTQFKTEGMTEDNRQRYLWLVQKVKWK